MASSADGALYSLKYSSNLSIPQEQVDPTLSRILAAALKNNPQYDITGVMYVDRQSKALVQVRSRDGPGAPFERPPELPSSALPVLPPPLRSAPRSPPPFPIL